MAQQGAGLPLVLSRDPHGVPTSRLLLEGCLLGDRVKTDPQPMKGFLLHSTAPSQRRHRAQECRPVLGIPPAALPDTGCRAALGSPTGEGRKLERATQARHGSKRARSCCLDQGFLQCLSLLRATARPQRAAQTALCRARVPRHCVSPASP